MHENEEHYNRADDSDSDEPQVESSSSDDADDKMAEFATRRKKPKAMVCFAAI